LFSCSHTVEQCDKGSVAHRRNYYDLTYDMPHSYNLNNKT